MNEVWWRAHLRTLPDNAAVGQLAGFNEADELMPFLTEALDLPSGGRVLDLGCARGAFSVRLAQWGYRVTAVEESAVLLSAAREAARPHELDIAFRRSGQPLLPERSAFDGALVLEFGGGTDTANAETMREVAAALRPGGRVVFGTPNPYYWAREPRTEHRVLEGMDVIRKHSFDFASGTVTSRVRCVLASGQRLDLPAARHRAYTLPELRALTTATGLADLRIYGQDAAGRPRTDLPLDNLRTPFFHCVAIRPVVGEAGEGI